MSTVNENKSISHVKVQKNDLIPPSVTPKQTEFSRQNTTQRKLMGADGPMFSLEKMTSEQLSEMKLALAGGKFNVFKEAIDRGYYQFSDVEKVLTAIGACLAIPDCTKEDVVRLNALVNVMDKLSRTIEQRSRVVIHEQTAQRMIDIENTLHKIVGGGSK